MIDIDKAIANAEKTGKVSFGADSAIKNAKTGKVKMIIVASNCPENTRKDIEYYCKLSAVPLITHKGSSLDLAGVCGKPFVISALSIREPGDSEILKLIETPELEEAAGGDE
jgi:large subunit ribosomal protein L30e